MAHFAQLDDNNTVIQVIVVNNSMLLDNNNIELEENGIAFCKSLFGQETHWKQTSYSGSFRKNFASIGSLYDSTNDIFIAPKPFNSWILNKETIEWEAPVPYPENAKFLYYWDEQSICWIPVNKE
jgi:hypothetical protein